MLRRNGCTEIGAKSFYEGRSDVPRSVVVVLMSDGQAQDPSETVSAAKALKQVGPPGATKLATCLFAAKGEPIDGARLLEAIASPGMSSVVYSPEQLREFFAASITKAADAAEQKR